MNPTDFLQARSAPEEAPAFTIPGKHCGHHDLKLPIFLAAFPHAASDETKV
jgi:hypothetical protein